MTLCQFGVPFNHCTSKNIQLVYSKWNGIHLKKSVWNILSVYQKHSNDCWWIEMLLAGKLLPEIVGNSREEFPWIFGAFPTSYNFTVLLLRWTTMANLYKKLARNKKIDYELLCASIHNCLRKMPYWLWFLVKKCFYSMSLCQFWIDSLLESSSVYLSLFRIHTWKRNMTIKLVIKKMN